MTQGLRSAALIFGALTAAEIGWAIPDPAAATAAVVWLHRNVLLMVALAGMTALHGSLYRAGRRTMPIGCARVGAFGPLLGVLASLILLVLLVQEFRLYDAALPGTPMAGPRSL